MIKLLIKPLSVNSAFKGRRFRHKNYDIFEKSVLTMLPPMDLPDPPYEIHYEFGFSSVASDVDNPAKCTTDVLSKKYGFNDKHVFRMVLEKTKVKKGDEYIKFQIIQYKPENCTFDKTFL
jgi:Holliday junction resolvase RusA-like endonuclease